MVEGAAVRVTVSCAATLDRAAVVVAFEATCAVPSGDAMARQLLGEELVDVTLSAEGRTVGAHRVVLSACSPYFKQLFKVSRRPSRRG